jgi:hypothetical protein
MQPLSPPICLPVVYAWQNGTCVLSGIIFISGQNGLLPAATRPIDINQQLGVSGSPLYSFLSQRLTHQW